MGAASAALYVDSSSELEGSKETPWRVTPASPTTPAAATPATAISGASGATITAASISTGLITFRALIANKPLRVTLTLEQEA